MGSITSRFSSVTYFELNLLHASVRYTEIPGWARISDAHIFVSTGADREIRLVRQHVVNLLAHIKRQVALNCFTSATSRSMHSSIADFCRAA